MGTALLQILGDVESKRYQQIIVNAERELHQADSTVSGSFTISPNHSTSLQNPGFQVLILSPWSGPGRSMVFKDPDNQSYSFSLIGNGIEYEWSNRIFSLVSPVFKPGVWTYDIAIPDSTDPAEGGLYVVVNLDVGKFFGAGALLVFSPFTCLI